MRVETIEPQGAAGAPEATSALAERIFGASIAALELAAIHLGHRLGLYRGLDELGEATPAELSERAGTAPRYTREWLEQQAVAGILDVATAGSDPDDYRYALPAGHRPVLIEEEDPSYMAPLAQLTVGVLKPIERLLAAYRSGEGVPYAAYGDDTREGIATLNRPMFANELAGWLQAVPAVHARLTAEEPARVADLACGTGWSSIAIARAYPSATVDALDLDEDSIAAARRNVEAAGLEGRVRPSVRDAADPGLSGRYDLVTIFEALHDMDHPVRALESARALLAEGGSVIVADERVAESFAAPGDEIERFNYGWSVLHCLAVGSMHHDSAATGTVIRPETVRAYAGRAGFDRVEVLPVENDFWRFYRLLP